MSLMLTGYSNRGCQEFIMPEKDNANHSIILDHNIFGIAEDLSLHFDILNSRWRFVSLSTNCTLDHHSIAPGKLVASGDIIYILSGSDRIAVIATEFTADISAPRKFSVSDSTSVSIGTEQDNDIIIEGIPLVSRHHAVLTINRGSCTIVDKSSNGTFVNDKRIQSQRKISYGDRISLFGTQIVWLGDVIAIWNKCGQIQCSLPSAPTPAPFASKHIESPSPTKKRYFRRSPRNLPRFHTEKIEIDAPPQPQKVVRRPLLLTIGPSLTMALPMIIGTGIAIYGTRATGASAGFYMYTGIIIAVLSAIIGTIWALVNLNYSKKQEVEGERLRTSKYKEYLDRIERELSEKYTYNSQNLNYIYPDVKRCAQYCAETPDLWNRNMSHEDFFLLRLGTGSLPFQCPIITPQQKFSLLEDNLLTKPSELAQKFEYLKNVPIGIDLKSKPIIGVVGQNQAASAAIMRDLVIQAAANICYTDLKMVFLFDGDTPTNLATWSFAKWLPHVWSSNHKIRYFASNENERSEVCFYLANILRLRAEETSPENHRKKPHYLVFVSTPELLEGIPAAKYLLGYEKGLGVTTILFAERFEQLPNRCVDIIEHDSEFSGVFNIGHDSETRMHIDFDSIDIGDAEKFARSLTAVEVEESENGGEIPESLTFLDMYQAHTVNDLNISERWIKNRTYDTMRVPIGQKSGDSILNLDIHENYHGPHGLVAGTTGSGKSEILQTYILSLAINFSPDDVAFFLIDFKGGGMANLFSSLPHLAGYISNLSGNQIHRAMVSIKSENRRRQKIFSEFTVNHIDQYTRLFKAGEAVIAIPHLFIIIDEFAELKRDQPDFMRELISVAQVGRSLGVHLILATQKPGGTVDDNIWSNTRFKLCLRVQDKQDSNDVLHKSDAAYLSQAGRCYLQVGNDEIYELFQSGWSGATYYDDQSVQKTETVRLWNNVGDDTSVAGSKRQRRGTHSEGKEASQLSAIVSCLAKTAAAMFPGRPKFRLWLPILPEKVYLFDFFKEPAFNGEEWPESLSSGLLSVPVGLYDDPANQAQAPLIVDFAENGNLAVCGSVVSGKSTFMQTLLYALVHKYSPAQLNIYILDYSNHMLEPFSGLSHVGDVVFDTQLDKTEKLFILLTNMIEERKKLFQGGSYAQFIKANGQVVPYILLMIDNYASFREKTDNKYESNLLALSREGMNYGLYLVISAGGFGAGELQNRIADNFHSVVCLEMGDKFKYSEVLRTPHLDVLPENNIKGRGLANIGGRTLEFQTALAIQAADDYARAEKLRVCFSEMNRVWNGPCAKHIPTIPENPTWSDFLQSLEADFPRPLQSHTLPFAWNSKDAAISHIDLSTTYCWLITGKTRTGKTNLLKVLATSAALSNSERYILDFSGNKLQKFSIENQSIYISDAKALFEALKGLIPKFKERNTKKQELLAAGFDEAEIYAQLQRFQPIFLFIDNLDDFMKAVYIPPEGVGSMAGFIENIMEKGYLHNIYIVAGYDYSNSTHSTGRKAFNHFISYRTGIHLGGNVAAQRIFDFSSLPYSAQSKVTKPGTGLIPPNEYLSAPQEVIIPLLKG